MLYRSAHVFEYDKILLYSFYNLITLGYHSPLVFQFVEHFINEPFIVIIHPDNLLVECDQLIGVSFPLDASTCCQLINHSCWLFRDGFRYTRVAVNVDFLCPCILIIIISVVVQPRVNHEVVFLFLRGKRIV